MRKRSRQANTQTSCTCC